MSEIKEKKKRKKSGFVFIAYVIPGRILLLPCVMVYYIVSVLFLRFFWCPCMAINNNVVSV